LAAWRFETMCLALCEPAANAGFANLKQPSCLGRGQQSFRGKAKGTTNNGGVSDEPCPYKGLYLNPSSHQTVLC